MKHLRALFEVLRETFRQWREEDITRLGAALAYFAAFSIIPMLLIAAAIAGTLWGSQNVENQIMQRIRDIAGHEAAQPIRDALKHITPDDGASSVTTIVSAVALLFGATGFFRHLKSALNVVWNVPAAARTKVHGFFRDTVLSVVLVVGLGLLLLVVLIANTALFALLNALDQSLPNVNFVGLQQAVGVLVLFLTMLVIFALIYRLLPDAHVTWRDVWIGASMTSLLFTVGQVLIIVYLSATSMETIYGAASALVFILMWVYFSSHLILFGAEFTQVYANQRGGKVVPTEKYEQEKAIVQHQQVEVSHAPK